MAAPVTRPPDFQNYRDTTAWPIQRFRVDGPNGKGFYRLYHRSVLQPDHDGSMSADQRSAEIERAWQEFLEEDVHKLSKSVKQATSGEVG